MAKTAENPVGPEAPSVHFNFPLWQVLLALFLIALAITAYQLYEQQYIAPHQTVQWEAFTVDRFRQARRQRRNVLVLVAGHDQSEQQKIDGLLDSADFRRQVYLRRATPLVIQSGGEPPEEVREVQAWLEKNANQIKRGGLAWFDVDATVPPRLVPFREMTNEQMMNLFSDE